MPAQYTLTEQKFRHTEDHADSEVRTASFEGVSIIFASGYQQKEVKRDDDRTEPFMDMYFCLEGCSAAHSRDNALTATLTDAQHTIYYTPEFHGYYSITSPVIRLLSIEMKEPFFERFISDEDGVSDRFWDQVLNGEPASLTSRPMPVTGRQMAAISDLQYGRYSGFMKQLFLESRITDLFLLQMEQAQLFHGIRPPRIKPADREKLYAAREFVKQHVHEPFSLLEVARHCGLNDFKLKKGFRELFGNTVFGYLNDLKMNHALELLRDTSRSVFEVADSLGYSEAANFSKAFKKHFGQLPKDIRHHD
ncbi:helix-turn-helix transcriptional regulator [Chitinophaga barathri]|uniref:AraC family transcriptional regulator n=1 Tax=Chitinophaga barathri TaxID=1647451 RepID=A0A3N4MZV3_9BACT|nr:AraC family transcriptional regulator [Chitinophaga barathri]RPD40883.1 AraC family transcriptional regulator [Chitinophaga barathri]